MLYSHMTEMPHTEYVLSSLQWLIYAGKEAGASLTNTVEKNPCAARATKVTLVHKIKKDVHTDSMNKKNPQ